METTLLLGIVVGLLIVVSVWGIVTARRPSSDPDNGRLAVSTEGMKVCPKCGMGNLWTERRCSACGNSLKG